MSRLLRRGVALACLGAPWLLQVAAGAELSPAAEREIALLLDKISASSCSFNRNGSWYTAVEARRHIERKRDWLAERGMLESADQFIAQAASESSLSGRPYLMKCGQDEPKRCSEWLRVELQRMRQAGPAK